MGVFLCVLFEKDVKEKEVVGPDLDQKMIYISEILQELHPFIKYGYLRSVWTESLLRRHSSQCQSLRLW